MAPRFRFRSSPAAGDHHAKGICWRCSCGDAGATLRQSFVETAEQVRLREGCLLRPIPPVARAKSIGKVRLRRIVRRYPRFVGRDRSRKRRAGVTPKTTLRPKTCVGELNLPAFGQFGCSYAGADQVCGHGVCRPHGSRSPARWKRASRRAVAGTTGRGSTLPATWPGVSAFASRHRVGVDGFEATRVADGRLRRVRVRGFERVTTVQGTAFWDAGGRRKRQSGDVTTCDFATKTHRRDAESAAFS